MNGSFFACVFFCFKQKTAYEMRISDWSSDVCSSDLSADIPARPFPRRPSVEGNGIGRAPFLGRSARGSGSLVHAGGKQALSAEGTTTALRLSGAGLGAMLVAQSRFGHLASRLFARADRKRVV